MTVPQRAVNLLYAARDYAPVANTVALIALPCLLLPLTSVTQADHQMLLQQVSPKSRRNLRYLLSASWLSSKLTYLIIYNQFGLSRVWNFESSWIWAAPCELLPFFPFALSSCFPASSSSSS